MEHRAQLRLHTIDAEGAIELPNREVLSLVNANLAIPINAALSANILSDGALAASNAQQMAPVSQGMMGTNPLAGFS